MSEGPFDEPLATNRRAITWRSVLLGLAIAVFISAITPYNDYVVWNSFIVGSYFPPVATLSMLAIVLLINGPLHKLAPRFALSPGELSIIVAMALISCSIPSQGLLRQVVPIPVAPFYVTGTDPKYHDLFVKMDLPKWLFAVDSLDTGHQEMSVTKFYSRLAPDESLPWGMWLKPFIGWGVFSVCFLIAMVSIACLVRFQWAVNERLPFPIAQLQSMLIAPPARGRAFNNIFSSKGFWIAAGLVIIVQGSNGLHTYFPGAVPAIPYSYDLTTTLTDVPWDSLAAWPKRQTIFFTLLGVVYFTQTRVSFSLWMAPLLLALIRWPLTAIGDTTLSDPAIHDQGLGASFAFIGGIIWIGRHHWMVILRAFLGVSKKADPQGAFVGYRLAMIALIIGVGGMFAWLLFVGCQWPVAGICVLMILMSHIITARVVAETGLAYLRVPVNMDSIIKNFPVNWMTPRDAFFYGTSHYAFMQAARESTLVFTLTGLQVIDSVDPPEKDRRRTIPVLTATLAVALIAGTIASLYCYYNYVSPLDPNNPDGLLNVWGTKNWPATWLVEFPTQVKNGAYAARSQTSWLHIGIGLTIMLILQALTWRFNAWPLMPVGYLMCSASTMFYVNNAAFSLFLGWLFKTLILRFGGATLFNNLKPVFIGLIFGEALSTGIWLIVTLVLAMHGDQFYVVKFLPQ